MSDLTGEKVLNLGENSEVEKSFVARATDPVISPAYSLPKDFAAQYPTPLDPTEFIAMCEEVTLLQAIPEERTSLKQHTWRDSMNLSTTLDRVIWHLQMVNVRRNTGMMVIIKPSR